MKKKYILTDETKILDGHVLYRIQAVRDFSNVKKGDFGGFIESEDNLPHKGKCWIYNNACVYENARVYNDAQIRNNAKIYNYAKVYNKAKVYRDAEVFGNAKVYDKAKVYNKAKVYENAEIYGETYIEGSAIIYGNSKVYENAYVDGFAKVFDNAEVYEYAIVRENAKVHGYAKVYDNQVIKRGTVTKDILKEKDWELALRCLDETIEIKNGKCIVYMLLQPTKNKNIFISKININDLIIQKNKIINNIKFKLFFKSTIYISSYFAKCEIYLNDISLVYNDCAACKKIKILDIIKGGQ